MALDQTNKGGDKSIRISDEVIASIAAIAIQDIAGVVKNTDSGKLNSKKLTKNVKSEVKDGGIVVDMDVAVEYGTNIPEIAWEIQRKVKKAVESMTGLSVLRANINVKDVKLPEELTDAEGNKE
ncbi:MAG: Asp23/Gls24 family envelope stress response protein [Clostridia bacterium]|nr:Asp23/Gls24 family envelope stress response protein [Clostridia bacterium]